VSTSPVSEAESAIATLTAISLTNSNFSHNVFTSTGGLSIVDIDPGGEIEPGWKR
jgi:hypothetical protein